MLKSSTSGGTIEVVNIKIDKRPGVIYVGRRMPGRPGSPLGNPFKIGRVDDPLGMYRRWLWEQMQSDTPALRELEYLSERYAAGETLLLGCWCAPGPCHADIIKRAIEWLTLHRETERGKNGI